MHASILISTMTVNVHTTVTYNSPIPRKDGDCNRDIHKVFIIRTHKIINRSKMDIPNHQNKGLVTLGVGGIRTLE